MKEDDYKFFLTHVHNQGKQLFELSQKFSDLTQEAKKVLDSIRSQSDKRKDQHGVTNGEGASNHHRPLPRDVKEKLLEAVKEVSICVSISNPTSFRWTTCIFHSTSSLSRPSQRS